MYYIRCLDMIRAHLQEVKIVFLQHLVSSLSVSGRAVHNFDLLKISIVLLETCRGI
jgi:hypothetical protein